MASKATATSAKAAQEGMTSPGAPAAEEVKMSDTTSHKSNKIYCYIGPNIRGHFHTGEIFRGEKGSIIKAHAELIGKHPLIKALIIPGEALAVARLKVKEPGTAHYANYHKLGKELLEEAQEKVMPEYLAYKKEHVDDV